MKIRLLALPVLALALGSISFLNGHAQEAHNHLPLRAGARWTGILLPSEFREVQREGYHDGIEGARKDYNEHRRPDVNNRDEYRHPHVERSAEGDYSEGFRRGYEQAMNHMMSYRDRHHDHDDHDHDHDNK